MNNQIAITIGLLLLIGFGIDQLFSDGSGTLFLARKLAELIEWLAFWR